MFRLTGWKTSILLSILYKQTQKNSDGTSKKILSFAGSFGDMSEKDFNDFLEHTKNTRNTLFDRDINL